MPDYDGGVAAANVRKERTVSIRFVYTGGISFNTTLGAGMLGDSDYSLGEISNWREKIAGLSNMGVISQSETVTNEVSPQWVRLYDESYSVNKVLNLRFQNNDLDLITVPVPAPHRGFFVNGTLIEPNAGAAANSHAKVLADAIDATADIINNSFGVVGGIAANSYAFVGGELGDRKMAEGKKVVYPAPVEPIAGVPPSQ